MAGETSYIKKTALILGALFLASPLCYASENAEKAFKRANYFYSQGEYIGAIKTYRELLKEGYINAALFYNLGNAYYQNKELGRALLQYRRALRLSPRDKDIRFNYQYVYSLVNTEIEEGMGDFFYKVLSYFTVNELTVCVSVIYFLFIGFLLFRYLFRKDIFLWISVFLGLVLFIGLGAAVFRITRDLPRLAITLIDEKARNGPGSDYSIGFHLPEGKEVEIIDEHEGWLAINLQEKGLKGWVKKDSIEEISIIQ